MKFFTYPTEILSFYEIVKVDNLVKRSLEVYAYRKP